MTGQAPQSQASPPQFNILHSPVPTPAATSTQYLSLLLPTLRERDWKELSLSLDIRLVGGKIITEAYV